MIVISKSDSVAYGERPAPVGIYVPIKIKGNLYVLPDLAEKTVKDLSLSYEKRGILNTEWVIPLP